MSAPERGRTPSAAILWAALAAAPAAWLLAFTLFLLLTNHACPGAPVKPMAAVGCVGVAIAAGAAISALFLRNRLLRQRAQPAPGNLSDGRARFMLELATGLGILFALLIAVSTVPVVWLSTCPT